MVTQPADPTPREAVGTPAQSKHKTIVRWKLQYFPLLKGLVFMSVEPQSKRTAPKNLSQHDFDFLQLPNEELNDPTEWVKEPSGGKR